MKFAAASPISEKIQWRTTVDMSKVSVIIPTYNAACWIVETVRSVQQQTYPHIEILIIDDGSTDDTVQVVIALEDSRLQVYCLAHAGVSIARNHGIQQASGAFIAFLDADDLWQKDMLTDHVSALQKNPSADVSYCWTSFIDEASRHLGRLPACHYTGNVYHKLVIKSFFGNGGTLVVRRSAIEKTGYFDHRLSYGEDFDYWLRLAKHSHFVVVPQYQFFYRRWSESTTAQLYQNDEKIALYKNNLLVRREKWMQMHSRYTAYWQALYYRDRVHLELKLYLYKDSDYQHVRDAMRLMWDFLSTQPRGLAQKTTIKILGKLVLIALLPQPIVIRIIGWYRHVTYQYPL